MSDRLTTFLLVLGALLMVYLTLVGPMHRKPVEASPAWSTADGPNGYLALTRWLESADIEPASLRQRFDCT